MDYGLFIHSNLNVIHNEINTQTSISLNQIDIMIQQLSKNLDLILIIASSIFVIIAIILIIYMSKVIVYPLNKFFIISHKCSCYYLRK